LRVEGAREPPVFGGVCGDAGGRRASFPRDARKSAREQGLETRLNTEPSQS